MRSPQGFTTKFSERQLAGMAAWNQELRYVYSPPTSIWANEQRGEFVRILAEAFNVGERNVRTWFALNQRQTPFLRKDLPTDVFVARSILAKCLLNVVYVGYEDRVEFVRIKGVNYNLDGVPLAPLLTEENYYRDTFHWEYNAHDWNPNAGDSIDEIASFHLIWYYGLLEVPYWLPDDLRPRPMFDAEAFGLD